HSDAPTADPILTEASEKFATASFNYDIDMNIDFGGTDFDASGTGAVQAPVSGFLNIGAKSRGLSLNLNGDLEGLPVNVDTVALGNTLYMNGLLGDGWVAAPASVFAGGAVVNPRRMDDSFLTVTRESDDTINGAAVAVFAFDYDLSDPAAQTLIAGATAGMDSMGGFIATGQQAASIFAAGDLTMVQYIDLNTKEVRRIEIDFDVDDTDLEIQIDIPEGYSSNITITAPEDAQSLSDALNE
ncbi:MAG: hypothetical protein AAFV33_24675, partial [Chloroflexota bacterium]